MITKCKKRSALSELYKVTAGRIQLSTIETWTFHSVENQYGVLSELSAWAVR